MNQLKRPIRRSLALLSVVTAAGLTLAAASIATAEYGDVIMNRSCDANGAAPVVFPHWFHRIRYRCKVCHGDLGFVPKAGGNEVTMLSIIDGQHCGACHNGDIAWSSERCDLCHTGKRGLATQTQKGTALKLAPASQGRSGK
jgi:c(7)-type cytochrome triheme protein